MLFSRVVRKSMKIDHMEDRMKRSIISILMAAALLAPVFAEGQKDAGKTAAPGGAAAGYPAMVLKLGHIAEPSHPYALGADKLAELVKQKTGGKVVIQVFPSSQLGDQKTLIRRC